MDEPIREAGTAEPRQLPGQNPSGGYGAIQQVRNSYVEDLSRAIMQAGLLKQAQAKSMADFDVYRKTQEYAKMRVLKQIQNGYQPGYYHNLAYSRGISHDAVNTSEKRLTFG